MTSAWYRSQSFWVNKNHDEGEQTDIPNFYDFGTRREYDYRPYYRSNRLENYYLLWFSIMEIIHNTNLALVVTIKEKLEYNFLLKEQ